MRINIKLFNISLICYLKEALELWIETKQNFRAISMLKNHASIPDKLTESPIIGLTKLLISETIRLNVKNIDIQNYNIKLVRNTQEIVSFADDLSSDLIERIAQTLFFLSDSSIKPTCDELENGIIKRTATFYYLNTHLKFVMEYRFIGYWVLKHSIDNNEKIEHCERLYITVEKLSE